MDQGGDLAQPRSRGELYSVDARTGHGRLVFGYRAGEDQVGSRVRRGAPDQAWGFVLDTLPNDDRRVLVDPRRICIYGASFGGYAALRGASLAPDLFRCAVGYAGIYDLTRANDADFAETSRLGRGFVRTAIGDDEAALRAASPAFHADEIKARVLLIHGRADRRVPIEQAERLREALEKSGNPPEWLVEPLEGARVLRRGGPGADVPPAHRVPAGRHEAGAVTDGWRAGAAPLA